MPLRICSYNIKWFDHLFTKTNRPRSGKEEKRRISAIATVIKHIDPDLIGILEAPNTTSDGKQSTVEKLENFAGQQGLRVNKALIGFISRGTQEIAILYDPAVITVEHCPGGDPDSKTNPPFDREFFFDTDDDQIKEVYHNFRPPLEAIVRVLQTGFQFRLIVAHTKSKGIFNSVDMLHWQRTSLRNRLRLFAECQWIRQRVDEWLDQKEQVVVMGDFNDGPGMDFYEFRYGRSAVEIVMGDIFQPKRILRNPLGRPRWTSSGWKPASARFKDRITGSVVNVLIDHILFSEGLPVAGKNCYRLWNPFEYQEAKAIKAELLSASDHFPISLDIDIG